MTMLSFKKCHYVSVAIDEGSVQKVKYVDSVLENPWHTNETYPYYTLEITDQTADGYFPIINQGIGNLTKHNINVGSVILDGNTAKKSVSIFNGQKHYVSNLNMMYLRKSFSFHACVIELIMHLKMQSWKMKISTSLSIIYTTLPLNAEKTEFWLVAHAHCTFLQDG